MNKVDLKRILKKVEKPARYLGNEINSIHKDTSDESLIRYAQCFPDLYEVGMSHLGSHILYDVINRDEKIFCERVYAPAVRYGKYDEGKEYTTICFRVKRTYN